MKKLGTVSGVTCGRLKLKFGLEISGGVPLACGAGPTLAPAGGTFAAGFGAAGFGVEGVLTWGFGVFGLGVGAVCVVEVLELDEVLELELEELDELEELEVEELEELEELGGGGQDSDVLATGPGRLSDDSGVPGASWKYRVWPLTRTTFTVQSAADADGSATKPSAAKTAPTVIAATFSFGRLNTVALSPPAHEMRLSITHGRRARQATE